MWSTLPICVAQEDRITSLLATRATCRKLLASCLLLVAASEASAGQSIEISVNNGLPIIIFDNQLGVDLNPNPVDMEVPFMVGDVGNTWTASGTIFATGGGGYPPVSTIVTDTVIQKINEEPGGGGTLSISHNYAASGTLSHTALLDGQAENTLSNLVGGVEFFFTAEVNTFGLGVLHKGLYSGIENPLFQFNGVLGPKVLPTTTKHILSFQFYFDVKGDAIRLFDSAEIHTVPEPATGAMFALAMAVLFWRRRSL